MIERIYRCNLCKDSYSSEKLYGLYWRENGWEEKATNQCENHICKKNV